MHTRLVRPGRPTDPVRPVPPAAPAGPAGPLVGRHAPARARRVAVATGLVLGLALTPALASTPAIAQPAPAPPGAPPGLPAAGAAAAPQDARGAQGGPQRWDPPLAGSTVRVDLTDGTARLGSARDGREASSSLRGAQRSGFLDLGTHQFGTPVNRVDVPVAADVPAGSAVEADVRGQGPDGQWTEWVPATPGAAAVLEEPTRVVGVRLVLTAPATAAAGAPGDATGPVVRSVGVLADQVATGPRAITPRAAYRVFATREGLVGGTTANGHVIKPNDQFVALPSRRGLSANGRGDYSVRICTDAKRCATVPVWDVGPWNTTDDYWNTGATRQRWKDLPQGRPQAQAAYENKYNGGKDGFGRAVKNPAGIDIADGTFWGLGLKNNAFVTVEYLWTARTGTIGQAVSPDAPVVVRSAPKTGAADVGVVGDGAQVDVACTAAGDSVTGTQGTSNQWLRIGTDQWTPAAFLRGVPPVPAC